MIFKLVMLIGGCTFLIVCDLESRAVIDLMCVYMELCHVFFIGMYVLVIHTYYKILFI